MLEETLFVLKINVFVTNRGGLITREPLPSDLISHEESRYIIHHYSMHAGLTAEMYNRAISDECYKCGFKSLPRFKDDGYYRFFDDAEQVKDAWIKLLTWMRGAVKRLPVKESKKILACWEHLLREKVVTEESEKLRTSMIGCDVKKRSDLSLLQQDLREELDYLQSR